MDDRSGVHERARERVLDGLDRRIGLADDFERVRAAPGRKGAGRQASGAHGDCDLRRSVLARKVGQRSGFGEGNLGAASRSAHGLRHDVAAEGARGQEHDLSVGEVRRQRARDVFLGEGGQRREHQVRARAPPRRCPVSPGRCDGAAAAGVPERDERRRGELRDCGGIAPPQPHLVSLLGEVGGGGVAAVPAAQHGDTHVNRPWRRFA